MPPKNVEEMLKENMIIGKEETYDSMCKRVYLTIAEESRKYGANDIQIKEFANTLETLFKNDIIVPSTPILTNAGRFDDRPLSACSVPPLDYKLDRTKLAELVRDYHKKGMGTGFNFDDSANPVEELLFFNNHASEEFKRKEMDRPVGNMGIISIDHPKVLEFAATKAQKYRNADWKFNISINLKSDFMEALNSNGNYKLKDGTTFKAVTLFNEIIKYAHSCGDPGLVFLDRFEEFNVTPQHGKILSLAPCGEISMAHGETCQFSYINLAKFQKNEGIDYTSLRDVVNYTVLMLDNALDISARNIDNETSKNLIEVKRKIGLGVCGFADLLSSLSLPYDSVDAVKLAEDIMSFINYQSKLASINLAKKREPFVAFFDNRTKKELIIGRYLGKNTNTVSETKWKNLYEAVDKYGIRNVSTIALPPTGRSSMVIGASASIEPHFRLSLSESLKDSIKNITLNLGIENQLDKIYDVIERNGSLQSVESLGIYKDLYKTCLELSPESHLNMVAAFQKFTDESISKTVNLPNYSNPNDVAATYLKAYDLGLKGITVFRDGCKNQPKELANIS